MYLPTCFSYFSLIQVFIVYNHDIYLQGVNKLKDELDKALLVKKFDNEVSINQTSGNK